MFRFTMDNTVEVDLSGAELTTAGMGRDDVFADALRDTDDLPENETVFMCERPVADLDEAVEFVQVVFFHPPTRVWLDGEDAQTVTDEVVARVRKPTA
jgi:hypothetical protein